MARRVTLTFDNGPTPGVTETVLDILAARGIRATFFVIGEKVARGADTRALVARAAEEGHWIGNHTYTHRGLMSSLPEADAARREIEETQRLIEDVSHPDRFYRPCGGGGQLVAGLVTSAAVDLMVRGRYSLVLWNVVPRDWVDPQGWVERALAEIAGLPQTAEDWPLVVLHDVEGAALARLPAFLDRLATQGIDVVQEIPPAAMPIRRGMVTRDLAPYLG